MASARLPSPRVYTAKMPVTAADLLYDRVLPVLAALGVNRMLLDECVLVQGRQTWYIGTEEI
jgi:hypothetical protein